MDLKWYNFKHLYTKKRKGNEGFRVMYEINQLNSLLFFHSMFIHFIHGSSISNSKNNLEHQLTTLPKTQQMLIKLENGRFPFLFLFYRNYLQS